MAFLAFLILVSTLLLGRFGLKSFGDFSFSFSYLFVYAFLFFSIINKRSRIDILSLVAFSLFLTCALISFFFNKGTGASSSLFLLLFIYFPFIASPIVFNQDYKRLLTRWVLPFLVLLAFLGIFQFLIQFVYSPDWLFDFKYLIPDFLRNNNPMNTKIPFTFFFKANGFFLQEPALFSQFMALGILLASNSKHFVYYLVLFLFALVFSFSGTGLILLFFILVYFFFYRIELRKVALAITLLTGFVFYKNKDNYISSRASEFTAGATLQTSSAAARFLNPFILLSDTYHKSEKAIFWGSGPGSINRVQKDFLFHDPAWAKVLFEYGLIGSVTFFVFLFLSNRSSFHLLGGCLVFCCLFQYLFLGVGFLTFDALAFYFFLFKCLPQAH